MEAVNLLSESYIGIPSMCNATAVSVDSIGLSSQHIMKRAIRQQLKNRFDPKRCDDYFMQFGGGGSGSTEDDTMAPEWLDVLIQDAQWRQTLYELLEKYPSSSFLNFAVLVK